MASARGEPGDGVAPSFAFAPCPGGGVALDLATGTYAALDGSAAWIAARLAAGDPEPSVAASLAAVHRLAPERARSDVAALTRALAGVPSAGRNPLAFAPASPGGPRTLCLRGQAVLTLEPDGALRRETGATRATEPDGALALRWAAPFVLARLGIPTLHAAAVVSPERRPLAGAPPHAPPALALFGPSGAGKTTLARAFRATGWSVLAEDLLVLEPRGPGAHGDSRGPGAPAPAVAKRRLLPAGEAGVRAWAEAHAAPFTAGETVRPDRLLAALGEAGPTLDRAWLVGARGGETVAATTLGPALAIVALLESSFAELDEPEHWRQLLEDAREIAASAPVERVRVPEGLEALARALREGA